MLKILEPESVATARRAQAYNEDTLQQVKVILEEVKQNPDQAIRYHAERLGDIASDAPFFLEKADLKAAFDTLSEEDRGVLMRTAERIRVFAEAQRQSIQNLSMPVPGGHVGHEVMPVETAGCYAPGGRFPLPSSVLMTVIPARVAGVKTVWLASPKPTAHTLAAAYIAGADGVLCVGGAQAVAALAYGSSFTTACDVIVGPGNRWVTAAKQLLAGDVVIDMLAGPSELAVLADETADPDIIASDLLAQAEHDTDALPILISTDSMIISRTNEALTQQIQTLPTRGTAEKALDNGYAVLCRTMDEAVRVANDLAIEHLELLCKDSQEIAKRITHCGGLFIGQNAAEVIGDYGAGPNHTLPTGGTARSRAGLSVFTFMRIRTWINIKDPVQADALYADAEKLARIEGLEAHARAASIRRVKLD